MDIRSVLRAKIRTLCLLTNGKSEYQTQLALFQAIAAADVLFCLFYILNFPTVPKNISLNSLFGSQEAD